MVRPLPTAASSSPALGSCPTISKLSGRPPCHMGTALIDGGPRQAASAWDKNNVCQKSVGNGQICGATKDTNKRYCDYHMGTTG